MKTRKFILAGCLIPATLMTIVGCNSDSNSSTSVAENSTISCPAVAQAVSEMNVESHIPRAVKNFSDQGKMDEDQQLTVTIALNLNNQNDLSEQLHDLYDPTSPNYHHFMKPGEFRARYAPTDDQIADVKSYLESRGLQGFTLNDNGYLATVSGSVGTMNSAFGTEIHQYQSNDGSRYFAPATEPALPTDLGIRAVHGLQNVTHFRKYLHQFNAIANHSASPHGTGPNGGLSPSDVKTAYSVPGSVNGSGQTLALFELDGYSSSDITGYESHFGLGSVTLQNILVDGASGSAGSGADEVTLDIELMTALAPGASKILVYEAPNSGQSILDLYSRIANDDRAQQVSTSWGDAEDETTSSFTSTENTIFQQMAAQGQSIYVAAGDAGAYDDGHNLSVDDPGSQPYVVSVGGTHLNYSGSYISESSWNDGFGDAGGGGFSSIWGAPSWQNGVVSSQNKGCASMRNVPDVSLEADPNTGYAIYYHGGWTVFGGTSCAAPLWAAFTALVNQQRATNSLGSLGFPNPTLYSLGNSGSYHSYFHDIADGSTNLYYPAVTGYDDSTGWGSFNGTGLFNYLSSN